MNLKNTLIALVMSLCFAVTSFADEPSTRDVKSLQGVWVNYSGLGSARLDLNSDASGFLAIDTGAVVSTYRLKKDARTADGTLHFVSEAIGPHPARARIFVIVSGEALALHADQEDFFQQFWLAREASVATEADKLKRAVESVRSSP